jgi:hypothetical protein
MSAHITTDELFLAVTKGPKSLASNRYLHFENCDQCKNLYEEQISVDKALLNLKPVEAPGTISEKVLLTVERMAQKTMPKKKTDWIFLLAVVTLFSIGAWIMFSGKIAQYMPKNVTQIVTDQKEVIQKNQYIDDIKDKLPSINFNFKMPVINNYTFIVMLGLIAALFYFLLDRKLNQYYRVKKT